VKLSGIELAQDSLSCFENQQARLDRFPWEPGRRILFLPVALAFLLDQYGKYLRRHERARGRHAFALDALTPKETGAGVHTEEHNAPQSSWDRQAGQAELQAARGADRCGLRHAAAGKSWILHHHLFRIIHLTLLQPFPIISITGRSVEI
jgi:hypothetical protein